VTDDQQSGLKIVKVDKENHDTASIYFAGPGMERFRSRQAGQYASIRIFKEGKWTEPHPFTLSCAPEDDILRMTIKQSGTFTRAIGEVDPGTPVQCAGPFGQFCRGIDAEPRIVMLAGGVGITPFLSVLRHFRDNPADRDILLIWANKTPADAFAADELQELTLRMRLEVVHVFSRVAEADRTPAPVFDDDRPGAVAHEYGRITHEMLRRHVLTPNAAFYLCGPPPMQEAVLAALDRCGVDPERVRKEAFVFPKAGAPDSGRG
jgi:ferredoxin-NADP reductase